MLLPTELKNVPISPLTVHNGRYAYAVPNRKAGMQHEEISHKDISIIQIYTQVSYENTERTSIVQ